ncbi:MICOS complex subunit MIC60-like [Diadema antillarum]|uniref:MICOS complex subunit MIC60-like n=1 Tax=Diadema antillarum TaxID=105358 RepID=UPI003A86095C
MWRVSGSISRKIQGCCCAVRSPISQQHGASCRFCSKPGSAVPPGAPPKASPGAPPTPPAPTPPPRKSGGAMKVIMGGLLIAGGATAGTLAYAKANPDFRKQVESNWPILLDVFPYFFEDNSSGKQKTSISAGDNMTFGGPKKSPKAVGSPSPVPQADPTAGIQVEMVPGTTKAPPPSPAKPSPAKSAPAKSGADSGKKSTSASSAPVPRASQEMEAQLKKEEEDRRSKELEDKLIEQEIDEAANIAAYETIVSTCVGDSVEATRVAIETQKQAVEATDTHTEKLKIAMGDSQEDNAEEKKKQWDEVVAAAEVKLQAVTQASRDGATARETLAKLKTVLEEAKQTKSKFGPSPRLIGAQESLNQMTYDLDSATAEVVKAQSEALILKKFHELIEKGREDFKKELQSLMPEVQIGQKGKKLTEEELNSLIAHAHRRVYQLQRALAEQQAMEQQRLAEAVAKAHEADQEVVKSKILVELERQAADLAVLYRKKEEDLLSQAEQELRLQLRRQAAAHSDHLSDVLQQQQGDFDKLLQVQESAVRDQERDNYHQQLTGAMAKLRGVEAAIDGRAGLEMQNRKAQELWLACETLKRTLVTGNTEEESWEGRLKPLTSEIGAIQEASPNNKFVNSVIQTIPEEALTRGVFTEDSLRQRWDHTQRVCRRVAMMDAVGGNMFSYFLSYFQSMLVLNDPLPPNPEETVDPATLDTFKLVAYTSYHLENSNLEQALRYANQLTGMPRSVAEDWLREARLLLETSQAASVLSSHASAAGLGGLHFH